MTIVREFHEAFELDRADSPQLPNTALVRFRMRLLKEEFEEAWAELVGLINDAKPIEQRLDAMRNLLKELADLRYVIDGAAVAFGLDIDGAFEEVHRSNMSKLGPDGTPIKRQDGKVLKGPNYFEPDMEQFVPKVIDVSE